MPQSDVRFALNYPQWKAYESIAPSTTVNMAFGRGVGKSWFIRFILWSLVAKWDWQPRPNALKPFRGIRIVGLMPTLKQFRDVHQGKIEEELGDDWAFLGGKLNRSTMRIDFPGGSWFQPFPAEMAHSKRSRGLRADVVLGDEIDDIDIATWDGIARPWFSEPWSLKYRITGGTPTRGRRGLLYHLHKLGRSTDPRHTRYRSFHATHRDAPETVDAAEVEDARINTDPALFSREWECDFDSAEGLVFPMFSEDVHVRIPPEGAVWREVIVGADHGHNDPGVFLLIGLMGSGRDTIAWVLDEYYESGRDEDWWCERARIWTGWYPRAPWYPDPSMPSRNAALAKKGGARVREVDNSIDDGISTVANLMAIREREDGVKLTKLFVSPKCLNLIRELGLYRHKRDPGQFDKFTDTIVDKDNHTIDALRYALHNHLGALFGPSKRNDAPFDDRQ